MKKVMIVTGGSRGVGASTATLTAARGFAVCVNYHSNRRAANAIVDRIQANGGRAIAVAADVSQKSNVRRMFGVDEELVWLNALVNNAGILERQIRFQDVDATRLARVFAVKVIGPFFARGRRSEGCPKKVNAAAQWSTYRRPLYR